MDADEIRLRQAVALIVEYLLTVRDEGRAPNTQPSSDQSAESEQDTGSKDGTGVEPGNPEPVGAATDEQA